MGNVSKEAHVHLVGTQLLLFLHLCLTGSAPCCHHMPRTQVEVIGDGRSQGKVDEPCPPGIGWGRIDPDTQGALFRVNFIAGIVGGFHTEGVAACRQVGIAGRVGVARIDPVVVETV